MLIKYLGALIDENLFWKHHILHIASKRTTSIGIIARLRQFGPLNTLQHIYNIQIADSTLFIIWYNSVGPSRQNSKKQNPTSSETCPSSHAFCDDKTHAVPFFISSSLIPLDLVYFTSVAILMHDVSNNTSPPQISNLYNYQHNIYPHNARSSTTGNFFLEYSRLDKQNMSFSSNGVAIWNNSYCVIVRVRVI